MDKNNISKLRAIKKNLSGNCSKIRASNRTYSISENLTKTKYVNASKKIHKNLNNFPEKKKIVKLYNNQFFCSINDSRLMFTNFLQEDLLIDDTLKNSLNIIFKDSECIFRKLKSVEYSGKNSERIRYILNLYSVNFKESKEKLEQHLQEGQIYKTAFSLDKNEQGKIRIISVVHLDDKNENYILELLFIDLYHLFIPSSHKGYTSQKQLERTYNDYKTGTTHIKDFVKDNITDSWCKEFI